MASAIKANIAGSLVHRWEDLRVSDRKADLRSIVHQAFLPHEPSSSRVSERGHDSTASLHGNSTEYGPGYFVSKPSGVVHKSSKSRRRPYIKKRREQQGQSSGILHQFYGENEGAEKLGSKRKFGDTSFFASCIYGPTHYKRRVDLWERLSRIGVNRKESWCVFGDFNDILHNGEKTGGVWRQDESFAPFNQMINACKLEELQSHGNGFTWSGLRSNSWVHTRLDRCFGNRAWFKKPPLRKQSFFDANLQVSSLINTQTRRWSRSRLHELFVPADIKVLMRNQPVVSEPDSSFWKHTPNGIYSVKTGYDLAFWRNEQLGNKAREETRLWYVAQNLERRADDHRDPSIQAPVTWKCPPVDFLKCNIGFKWEKKKKIAGAAWVVRDSSGTVLLHSRRSFGEVESKSEAQFVNVAWAIESMKNHRYLKVHFAFEGRMLVNAIIRPREWPSFKFKVMEIRLLLRNFLEWRVLCESFEANRGARLIATSAVQDFRFQSYVATGAPRWCSHVF
ncbi:hypothetical protein YC2023_077846 [Brassica napus]